MKSSAAVRGRNHRLSAKCFAELARGSGSALSVAELRSGQRSRAMLLLRALVDIASAHPELPGPLPSAREAWHLLIRAERRSAAAVERLLLHPPTGVWLNRCLRRLRGLETGEGPLWRETGYLHAVAASAALLSGIDFRTAVPVREGGVMLPALGFARVADQKAEIAEVLRTPEGKGAVNYGMRSVPLPSDATEDAPGWLGLRRLRGEHQGHICSPFVDDIDPYRDFLRIRLPERLTVDEWQVWKERFDSAWQLVSEQSNVDPAGIRGCLVSVVPVPYEARPDPFSASSPEAYGCVLLNRPTDALTLAVALVHEAQHIKLSALMDLVPLIEGGLEEVHYAPWRLDPRPLRGLLQGVYAFLGVTGFWQARWHRCERGSAKDAAAFEFALRRAQTAHGLRTLRAHAVLTSTGERFLRTVEETLAPWLAEPLPPEPRRLADDLVTDHRLGYRMRHLRPDPAQTARWALAWRLRTAPPGALPGTTVERAPTRTAPRAALARLRLMDPGRFTRLCEDGGTRLPGSGDAPSRADLDWASRADLDWAAGIPSAALRGYRDRLAAVHRSAPLPAPTGG